MDSEKHKKDFKNWHTEKEGIDNRKHSPSFKEREIWWCKLGVNVGYEMDGKKDFVRPVLIIKKMSADTFFGHP